MTVTQSRRRTKTPDPSLETLPSFLLEQAEVCREQARDAARLKRFRAALGLFVTAANLCRHALTKAGDEKTGLDNAVLALATERLSQIDVEMATYTELARSHHII